MTLRRGTDWWLHCLPHLYLNAFFVVYFGSMLGVASTTNLFANLFFCLLVFMLRLSQYASKALFPDLHMAPCTLIACTLIVVDLFPASAALRSLHFDLSTTHIARCFSCCMSLRDSHQPQLRH